MSKNILEKRIFFLNPWFYLTLLFIVSFLIGFYKLPQNLFFGPEQGIDFLVIKSIVINHHFPLIGAKTDIQGVFHGPIYYYVASIPFFLSRGNPLYVASFLNFLDSLTVYFIYLFAKELVNKRTGIIASILFTVSYAANVYSRWLSSHTLVIPLSVLFFLFLNRFLKSYEKGKLYKRGLIMVAITYALLGQAEFLDFILFGGILFSIVLVFPKAFLKDKMLSLISAIILIVFSTSNFILFDFRHNFLISKSLVNLFVGAKGYYVSYAQSLQSNISVFMLVVSRTITPFSLTLAGLVVFFGIYFIYDTYLKKRNKRIALLLLWVYSFPFILFVFHHAALEQFFVGMICGIVIIKALITDRIIVINWFLGYGIFAVFFLLNVYALYINLPRNSQVFFQSTQPDLKYSDELKVIDTIYTRQKGKQFSYQSYTIPYWSQQGWDYLFWFYGKGKYGFLPASLGSKVLYVIVQDDPSSKPFQDYWLKNTVSKWGIEQKNKDFRYGALTVLVLNAK